MSNLPKDSVRVVKTRLSVMAKNATNGRFEKPTELPIGTRIKIKKICNKGAQVCDIKYPGDPNSPNNINLDAKVSNADLIKNTEVVDPQTSAAATTPSALQQQTSAASGTAQLQVQGQEQTKKEELKAKAQVHKQAMQAHAAAAIAAEKSRDDSAKALTDPTLSQTARQAHENLNSNSARAMDAHVSARNQHSEAQTRFEGASRLVASNPREAQQMEDRGNLSASRAHQSAQAANAAAKTVAESANNAGGSTAAVSASTYNEKNKAAVEATNATQSGVSIVPHDAAPSSSSAAKPPTTNPKEGELREKAYLHATAMQAHNAAGAAATNTKQLHNKAAGETSDPQQSQLHTAVAEANRTDAQNHRTTAAHHKNASSHYQDASRALRSGDTDSAKKHEVNGNQAAANAAQSARVAEQSSTTAANAANAALAAQGSSSQASLDAQEASQNHAALDKEAEEASANAAAAGTGAGAASATASSSSTAVTSGMPFITPWPTYSPKERRPFT